MVENANFCLWHDAERHHHQPADSVATHPPPFQHVQQHSSLGAQQSSAATHGSAKDKEQETNQHPYPDVYAIKLPAAAEPPTLRSTKNKDSCYRAHDQSCMLPEWESRPPLYWEDAGGQGSSSRQKEQLTSPYKDVDVISDERWGLPHEIVYAHHKPLHMGRPPGQQFIPPVNCVPGGSAHRGPYTNNQFVPPAQFPGCNCPAHIGETAATSSNSESRRPSAYAFQPWPPGLPAFTPASTPRQDKATSTSGNDTAKKPAESASPEAGPSMGVGLITLDILRHVKRLALIRKRAGKDCEPALTAVMKARLDNAAEVIRRSAMVTNDEILGILEGLMDMREEGELFRLELRLMDQVIKITLRRLMQFNGVSEDVLLDLCM
ncbi:MAG: hypothetical protein Q9193_000503 [Seirophora villosa]